MDLTSHADRKETDMEFVIAGVNPSSEQGRIFRNNRWWWQPLANFCLELHPEVAKNGPWHDDWEEEFTKQFTEFPQGEALALADALRADLEAGTVAAYATQYRADVARLAPVRCRTCEGTGARQKLTCWVCAGTGETEHPASRYPFTVDNVSDFVAFLTDCGGFIVHPLTVC